MTNKIALMLFMSVTRWMVFRSTQRKIWRVRMHRHKLDGLAKSGCRNTIAETSTVRL